MSDLSQVTRHVAQWIAAEAKRERSDAELIAATESLIDTCGCAIAGSRENGPRVLRDALAGASGECSLIGDARRASPHHAALINGTAAHALDYDDYELAGRTHASVTLVPVVLALGERHAVSGRAALGAYLVGYEVIQLVGSALGPTDYLNGFHSTATTGTFGATACACAMLGLDAPAVEVALGIASSLAAGIRVNFGTDVKPLHAGQAAANGVLAATLAAGGFTASEGAIERDLGFAFCHAPAERHLLAAQVERLVARQIGITASAPTRKPYAACGGTHSAIGAALRLRRKTPSLDAVEEIVVEGAEQYGGILIHNRPSTGLEAKFSMQGAVALALADGAAGIAQFTDESVRRASVQLLISKVELRWDPRYTQLWLGDALPAAVTLVSGTWREREEMIDAPGSPRNPMQLEDMMGKFRECTAGTLSETGALEAAERLRQFSELRSVAEVATLLRDSRT